MRKKALSCRCEVLEQELCCRTGRVRPLLPRLGRRLIWEWRPLRSSRPLQVQRFSVPSTILGAG